MIPAGAGWSVITPGAQLECRTAAGSATIRLNAVRPHKQRLLVRIDGVEGAEQAEAYIGARLYAPRERIPLVDGEYLDADLIGCTVRGNDGSDYGRVEAVQHYPASDMLIVDGVMLPMVAAFIRDVDMAARQIVIDPPAGLFNERGPS